jgi:stearoyl-CoA desaturase (delta-9 desaturase)
MQPVPTAAPPASGAPRAAWYRATRIAVSLGPLVAVHLALFAIPFVEFTLWSVVAIVVVTRISGLGVTVALHRYFSHRAFKTSRWFQFLLGCAGCTALQKGPLWWAAHHRLHHRHSDTPDDPHSPVVDGFLYGHCGWLFARDLMHPDHALVRDLAKYPELVWLDRLWMIPGLLQAAACYACLGLNGLVYGYCLGVVLVFQITFAVNSIGHLFGPQRFDTGEGSRNNLVLGYLAIGDGWHNNHHRAPNSARHGFAWYELDMSYQFIRLLVLLRLARDVKQPPASVLAGGTAPANPPDQCDPVAGERKTVSAFAPSGAGGQLPAGEPHCGHDEP